jgi:CubicO group peptidase (beta-lactamase class C family)
MFRALVLALFMSLFLTGCETQKSLTQKRIKSIEKGLLRAVFLKGQKPERLNLLERMQFYKVPGVSIAVLDKHHLEWAKSYGVKDIQGAQPVTKETIFQAGALSQPIAAAAALHFVDSGRLDLDMDVNAGLQTWKIPANRFTTRNKVTLRELLTHSAGFPSLDFPGYFQKEPIPGLSQVLAGEKPAKNPALQCEFEPGQRVRDSEAGYSVLQQLLGELEKKPFEAVARDVVLDPLSLKNSTFEFPLPEVMRPNAASGHLRDGRTVEGGWQNYPELAAKGLWTNPAEFATFVIELLQTAMGKSVKILSPAAARSMLTVQLEYKGFGFNVEGVGEENNFNLRGKTAGYSSHLVVYPSRGQGAVIMTNSTNGPFLIDEILRAISAAYLWPHFKPLERPLFRLEPAIYKQYEGKYQVAPDYVLDVIYEDYYLIVRPSGQAPTKFYVESETIFFSVDPYIRIQFRRDEAGRIAGLVLWQQDFEQEAKRL